MLSRRQFLKIGAAGAGLILTSKIGGLVKVAYAQIPGGTLDPLAVPKYATPLLIPPVMPRAGTIKQKGGKTIDYYEISMKQITQQILPAGLPLPTVWGYGAVTGMGKNPLLIHNAPSLTIEAKAGVPVRIKWTNDLKDANGNFLPHLLPVDPTLHWANPPGARLGVISGQGRAMRSCLKVQVQEGAPIAIGNVLVSRGEKCSFDRLPNEYSISIQPPGSDGQKPSAFTDRRAKQKKELELIYDISVGLLGSLDLNELCGKALSSITSLLKRIDSGSVFLIDPDSGKIKEIASHFKQETKPDRLRYSRSLVKRVVKEGKAVMMLDTAMENKADLSDSMEKIGVKSVICVPLMGKMGTRGAIYLQSVNLAHGFRKNDLFFLTSLSTPIALAIE